MQEDDFPLTTLGAEIFYGNREKVIKELRQLASEIKRDRPELFEYRIKFNRIVEVCTDKKFFINKSLEKGHTFKEVVEGDFEEEKETDFPLISYFERGGFDIFRGGTKPRTLVKLNESVEKFRTKHPGLFTIRRKHTHTVEVCTDRELLVRFLLEEGFEIKGELGTANRGLQENEISLSKKNLVNEFTGSKKTLELAARTITNKYPDLVVSKQNVSVTSRVFSDRKLFVEEMRKLGHITKTSRESLLEVQVTDLLLNQTSLISLFFVNSRGVGKIRSIINELRRQKPEIFDSRKNKTRIVDVCTDREFFIHEILTRGFRLRNED